MRAPLVFIGDSITDAGRRDDPAGLGQGYVRRIARALGDRASIVNTGVGGDRVRDLRARWERDAVAHEPSVLTVYVGINDTWRRYDAGDITTVEEFERDYRWILERSRAAGTDRLLLVEPYVLPLDEAQAGWAEDLDPKRAAVAGLAGEFGATFIPLHAIMSEAAERVPAASLAWDGVHPTPEGDEVIAAAWLRGYEDAAR